LVILMPVEIQLNIFFALIKKNSEEISSEFFND